MRGVQAVEIASKSVLNRVAGMPFAWSINPYRGCFHQCVFCYARRTHAFLEQDGLAGWGSQIYVKVNAPQALRADLRRKNRSREPVAIGTVTDPYQPLEGRYKLMRGILAALGDHEIPVSIITRSPLIVRDVDLLVRLARSARVSVHVSVATMDGALAREIEPTVAPPHQRMRAVRILAEAGIDAGIALAPVLPGITDSHENLEAVMQAAAHARAGHVWHSALNLRDVTRESFFGYLREHREGLVRMYDELYRGAYLPAPYKRSIDERMRGVRAAVALRPLPHVETAPPRALRLL